MLPPGLTRDELIELREKVNDLAEDAIDQIDQRIASLDGTEDRDAT